MYLTVPDMICLISIPAHYLSVQNAVNIFPILNNWGCFNFFRLKVCSLN